MPRSWYSSALHPHLGHAMAPVQVCALWHTEFVEVVHDDLAEPARRGVGERRLARAAGAGELEQHRLRVPAPQHLSRPVSSRYLPLVLSQAGASAHSQPFCCASKGSEVRQSAQFGNVDGVIGLELGFVAAVEGSEHLVVVAGL